MLIGGVGYAAGVCQPTAAQTEGPFYPVRPQRDRDWDLTLVTGKTERAVGESVIIEGRILDMSCQPIEGALVEIWQACHTGKYNHPSDPNTAELDPNFQYWGRHLTDSTGTYMFKTIIPGAYPANETWTRPPHIHFKITAPGQRSFTTQMYFEGQELNDTDLILNSLTPEQRRNVIVKFDSPMESSRLPLGSFDITLNVNGSRLLTPELD